MEPKISRINVSDIKFAPYNPRTIKEEEFERLKKSITEFGLVEPLVVNTQTNHVVGGNQRLKAVIELGYTEIDVVLIDVSLRREKLLNLALNKISGSWDYDKVGSILREFDKGDIEVTLSGFSDIEIDSLIGETDVNFGFLDSEAAKEEIMTAIQGRTVGKGWVLQIGFDDKEDAEAFMRYIDFADPIMHKGFTKMIRGREIPFPRET